MLGAWGIAVVWIMKRPTASPHPTCDDAQLDGGTYHLVRGTARISFDDLSPQQAQRLVPGLSANVRVRRR
jgi:hypothetical protein